MRATRALINLSNLRHNINEIKKNTKQGVKLCAAVKADCYGHGAVACTKELIKCGVEYLAVATAEEGAELRKAGIKAPIVMLSLASPEEIPLAVKYRIEPLVFDAEYIDLFEKAASAGHKKNFKVHLAVDSGMGRIGCTKKDAPELAKYIQSKKNLLLAGICTHFSSSDINDAESIEYTEKQAEYFIQAVNAVKALDINPGLVHCSASAAGINLKEFQFDMIRPGIILYGYYAGDMDREYFQKKGIDFNLKPVMTIETKVSAIRHIPKGTSVSYGRTWKARQDTYIAVLPIGYADGIFRRFGQNGLKVAINGKEYPVVGRICMDQCMVDLKENTENIKRWDTAVIFGSNENGAFQTAQDIADSTNTISYEITTGISKRVPRVFVN